MDGDRYAPLDRDLELLLGAWLREGPEQAPSAAVQAAIDAVAHRPRHRWSGRTARWRTSWESIRPGEPVRRLAWVAVVAAALLLAIVWAAILLSSRPVPLPRPLSMNGLLAIAVGGDLTVADPNGRRIEIIEAPGEERSDPAWSADGTSLAVRIHDVDADSYRLDLLARDGTPQRTILGPVDWIAPGLAWSLDGRWLAAATGAPGSESIVLVRADGGELRPLTDATGTRPVFDPRSERVAFVGRDGSGAAGLLVAGLAPGERPRLVLAADGPASVSTPAWTPDGTSLVVAAPVEGDAAGTPAVVIVEAGGGPPDVVRPRDEDVLSGPLVLADGTVVVGTATGVEFIDPRDGTIRSADLTTLPEAADPRAMTASPDGRRVAVLVPGACEGGTCRPGFLVTLSTEPDGTVQRITGALPVRLTGSDPDGWSLAWQPLARPDAPAEATDRQTCATQDAGTVSGPMDHERTEGLVLVCSAEASDPRVSGTFTLTLTIQEAPDDSATMTGTSELANPDGTWIGELQGTVAAGYSDHDVRATLFGTGAYAGLRAYYHVTGTVGAGYTSDIVIEPVEE